MSCPTCGHTMESLATDIFHCPRCGTLKFGYDVYIPKLVGRVRELINIMKKERFLLDKDNTLWEKMYILGIFESVNLPENR